MKTHLGTHGRQFGWEFSNGFVAYFWRSGWTHISLGLHVDWRTPNFEIHIPFGFIRIGMRSRVQDAIILEVS